MLVTFLMTLGDAAVVGIRDAPQGLPARLPLCTGSAGGTGGRSARFIGWGRRDRARRFVLEPTARSQYLSFLEPRAGRRGHATCLPTRSRPRCGPSSRLPLLDRGAVPGADPVRLVAGGRAVRFRHPEAAHVPILIAVRHPTCSGGFARRLDCPAHGTCPQPDHRAPRLQRGRADRPCPRRAVRLSRSPQSGRARRRARRAALPAQIEVLVVDDGSADGTADLVRARPETAPDAESGTRPAGARGAAWGQRRRGPGGDARRANRTTSSSPTPTWPRRPTRSRS